MSISVFSEGLRQSLWKRCLTQRGCDLQAEKHCFTENGFSRSGPILSPWQYVHVTIPANSSSYPSYPYTSYPDVFYDVIILHWARRILCRYLYILQRSRKGLFIFALMCMSVWLACVSAYHVHTVPVKARTGSWILYPLDLKLQMAGIIISVGAGDWTPGLLEEPLVLFTAEPSLHLF